MKGQLKNLFVALVLLALSTLHSRFFIVFAQGNLTPPGAPGPTMLTLAQIEPRTPISSVPFTITNPGAYYFTANLTGAGGSAGLTISTNDVTVDLKGFSLIGVAGSQAGINVSGSFTNVTIGNGTIRNWGTYGIYAFSGNSCTFQGLRIQYNGENGISAGAVTVVKDCVVEGNLIYGIGVGENSLVSGCMVRTNANGIGASNGSVVTGCSSLDNAGYGIYANSGVNIQQCTVRGNANIGITVQDACVVSGCTASENGSYGIWVTSGLSGGGSSVSGCSVTANLSDGINVAGYGNRIVDNVCSYNGASGATNSAGIRVNSYQNRIENNNLAGNQNRGLHVTVAGNFIIRNTATGNGVNYDITGTQTIGPDVTAPGIITTNNPWANFEF
jgi:parallel beta-helix repeat protein